MPAFNPAVITRSPGHTTFRGVSHISKGAITIKPLRQVERVRTQTLGRTASYGKNLGFTISLDPLALFSDIINLYNFFGTYTRGLVIAPHMYKVPEASINTATNVITLEDHPFTDGDEVFPATDGVIPTLASGVLSPITARYVNSLTADTLSLHPSSANAIANSNVLDFTSDGTGNFYLCVQRPLVVHLQNGTKLTFTNCAVIELPKVEYLADKLQITGNLVFQAFPDVTKDHLAADLFYVETRAAYTAPTWDAANPLTRPAYATWGAAPLDSFFSETGFSVEVKPELGDATNGYHPLSSKIFLDCDVMVKGRPIGITPAQMLERLELQGANLGEGVPLTPANFTLTADGHTFDLNNAVCEAPEIHAATDANLVGDVTWMPSYHAAEDDLFTFAES